ncbi:hypothetical protein Taro_029205 [Colocasia esculenta]|uniref:Uncharacterized protein n=1 Tax=Colocasia esculenta TaxID=4460 RepID=A0A843VSM4_COLES|nr:hypothetical protein [Colocasia esculenta]
MNINFDVPYEDMVHGARSGSSSGRRMSRGRGSSAASASGPSSVPPPLVVEWACQVSGVYDVDATWQSIALRFSRSSRFDCFWCRAGVGGRDKEATCRAVETRVLSHRPDPSGLWALWFKIEAGDSFPPLSFLFFLSSSSSSFFLPEPSCVLWLVRGARGEEVSSPWCR